MNVSPSEIAGQNAAIMAELSTSAPGSCLSCEQGCAGGVGSWLTCYPSSRALPRFGRPVATAASAATRCHRSTSNRRWCRTGRVRFGASSPVVSSRIVVTQDAERAMQQHVVELCVEPGSKLCKAVVFIGLVGDDVLRE